MVFRTLFRGQGAKKTGERTKGRGKKTEGRKRAGGKK